MDMLRDLADSAKALTKNPLGVIGLFIVLVYGFACLVLGIGGINLELGERRPIVWFIVVFPILILGTFYRLVTTHHEKLYAPSDFKDERLFFTPLSADQRSEKLDKEVQRIEAIEASTKETDKTVRSASEIRSNYVDAERLAFLAIEQELGKPVQKYVEVNSHGRKEAFDGLLVTEKEVHVIEIKYFSRPVFRRELLEAIIHRSSGFLWEQVFAKDSERNNPILWIVIVVDFSRGALPEFQKCIEELVKSDLFEVRFRFYHIDDLKKAYADENFQKN